MNQVVTYRNIYNNNKEVFTTFSHFSILQAQTLMYFVGINVKDQHRVAHNCKYIYFFK